MQFLAFLGRQLGAAIIAAVGMILLAVGYAQAGALIVTGFPAWALQATGAAFFIIAVVTVLFRYDQKLVNASVNVKEPARPQHVPVLRNPPRSDEKIKPISAPKKEGRIYVGNAVDPEYLVSHFKGKTEHQGNQITRPFLGKWMRVSGPFDDLRMISEDLAQVTLDMDAGFTTFYFHDQFDRLEILCRGQEITIEGRIDRVSSSGVQLEDCELV